MSNRPSGCATVIALVVVAVIVTQCFKSGSADRTPVPPAASSALAYPPPPSSYPYNSYPQSPGLSDDQRAERASEEVSGTAYADQGQPYGCTDDCSGHEAGYAWAQENEVADSSECGGNSQSFIEGCTAYAEAYQEAYESAEPE